MELDTLTCSEGSLRKTLRLVFSWEVRVFGLTFTGKQPRVVSSPELLPDRRCFCYRNSTPEEPLGRSNRRILRRMLVRPANCGVVS
jgi:hypothetical protein